ncbi:hypothetical protein [Kitasatospora sp. SolWspMP-SS2h]|uniref:hypothetical protein n=1 Tax=Kitasatospora sp. SolWspMP-SS2h TaxID=1305729 RepID=UPI0011B94752|nr:hypothetical protein [Kitasatospora sp. SolWspMP-SS2h]
MGTPGRVSGKVSVENSQFGLWEDDPFDEGGGPWTALEIANPPFFATVDEGRVKVRSLYKDHYASVTLEYGQGALAVAHGWEMIGTYRYVTRGAAVELWSLFSGPAGVELEFGEPQSTLWLQIFRRRPEGAPSFEEGPLGVPEGLEEYWFYFSPCR